MIRKTLSLSLMALLAIGLGPTPAAHAAGGVVPDTRLRCAVNDQLGQPNLSADVTAAQMASLTMLQFPSAQCAPGQITSLAGLEHATGLAYLFLDGMGNVSLAPLPASLQSLRLTNGTMTSLTAMPSLPALEELNLSNNQLANLSGLASLPALTYMDLTNNLLTSVAGLPAASNVTHLFLSGNAISSLSGFPDYSALQVLDLASNKLTSLVGLPPTLNSLVDLLVAQNPITNLSGVPASLPALVSLYLDQTSLNTLAGMPTSMPALQILQITQAPLASLAGLPAFPNLNSLVVNNTAITSVADIPSQPLLTSLNLSANRIQSFAGMKAQPELTTLWVNENPLTSAAGIPASTKLEWLTLNGNQLTNLSGLPALPALRVLSADDNLLTTLPNTFGSFPEVWSLSVGGNKIRTISSLSNLPKLTFLSIVDNQVTDLSPLGGRALSTIYGGGQRLTLPAGKTFADAGIKGFDGSPVAVTPIPGTTPPKGEWMVLNPNPNGYGAVDGTVTLTSAPPPDLRTPDTIAFCQMKCSITSPQSALTGPREGVAFNVTVTGKPGATAKIRAFLSTPSGLKPIGPVLSVVLPSATTATSTRTVSMTVPPLVAPLTSIDKMVIQPADMTTDAFRKGRFVASDANAAPAVAKPYTVGLWSARAGDAGWAVANSQRSVVNALPGHVYGAQMFYDGAWRDITASFGTVGSNGTAVIGVKAPSLPTLTAGNYPVRIYNKTRGIYDLSPANATIKVGAFDIYTTPGYWDYNGRKWHTACEPYSSTERCRTEIWANTVQYINGAFVSKSGYVFNNLTYKPSPRSLWTKNPLGAYGKVGGTAAWTAADGSKWKTECDTTNTGRGACRSFRWTQVVAATPTSTGYTYKFVGQWLFNNIVLFTD